MSCLLLKAASRKCFQLQYVIRIEIKRKASEFKAFFSAFLQLIRLRACGNCVKECMFDFNGTRYIRPIITVLLISRERQWESNSK